MIFIQTQKQLESVLLENTILNIEGFSLVAIVILVLIYWRKAEKNNFSRWYIFYTLLMVCYISSHMLKHLNEGMGINEIYFSYIKLISFVLSQFTWIVLCWTFTRPQKQFNPKILLVYILPAIYIMMLLTNSWHGLIGTIRLKTNDIGFYISPFCKAVHYLFLTAMLPILIIAVKNIFHKKGFLFKQGLIIVSTGLSPLIAYFYISVKGNFLPISDFDPVPAISGLTIILLGIAALKYRVLNLIPIVFKEFVEYINTPFVLLDNDHMVLYNNKAFIDTFSFDLTAKGYALVDLFLEKLSKITIGEEWIKDVKLLVYSDNPSPVDYQICIVSPEKKYYNITIQTIIDCSNNPIGKMIFLNDITVYKNLALVESELAATKARYEISRDAHDIIGHAMTHIIMYLREDLTGLSEEELQSRMNVVNALKLAEQKVNEFRAYLYQKNDNHRIEANNDLSNYRGELLSVLTNTKSSLPTNVKLNIIIDEKLIIEDDTCFNALKMICLEGINNALKHGHAENIEILIKQSNNLLVLNIIDDGAGCKNTKMGFGLRGMSERVHDMGGSMKLISDEGDGFRILAKIPYTLMQRRTR